MKREFLNPLYNTFDKFLNEYIINENSILDDSKGILSLTCLNEVFNCYIENADTGNDKFDVKVVKQFENATKEAKLNFAHAEWLWCFAISDIRKETKQKYVNRNFPDNELVIHDELFPVTFGNGGQWHTNNKYREIEYCLLFIKTLLEVREKKPDADVVYLKKAGEEFCLYFKDDNYELDILKDQTTALVKPKVTKYAMSNVLLYLLHPDKYERITSDAHKQNIVNAFSSIVESDNQGANIDEKIFTIRNAIAKMINNPDFDFYDEPSIKRVWNASESEMDFDELRALQYKKAIVFHGPPGTSKTYKAKELGAAFILNQYIKDKSRLSNYLSNPSAITKDRIHHLQLHANYTYENFIGGYLLQDGNTVLTPGSFLKICNDAREDLNENPDIPHILILDEINRVDISKLFGEVFSALEQRDYEISIGVGDLKVNIPRNLYIIGTMNEIDFSVERIDFALRRRFLWFNYGYNEQSLRNIISVKANEADSIITEDDVDRFIKNISELNYKIEKTEDLGKMFQVGHAFFADIVAIYDQYKAIKDYKRKNNFLFEVNGPADILWHISIKPILESFLGSLNENSKDAQIEELYNIYKR